MKGDEGREMTLMENKINERTGRTKRQQSWTSLFPTPSLSTFGCQVCPLVYYPFSFRMMPIALMMDFHG